MAQEPLDPTRRSALRTLGAGVGWSLTWNAFAAAQGATADRQSRPDFTGTWTEIQDDQPRYLSGDGVSVNLRWSSPVRITQDATSIIVTYTTRARSHAAIRMTYGLDGTETKNIDGASVNPQERRSRSAWDGNRLVLVSMADWPDPASGGTVPYEYREVLTLESATTLRLETSRTIRGRTASVVVRFQRAAQPR